MSDFPLAPGFEDVWRPPVRPRRVRPEAVLPAPEARAQARARLGRIARRVPEVMVKVTGRTRDGGHLAAHLSYITRNGELVAEDRNGHAVDGRSEVRDLAEAWWAEALMDSRRRANTPVSLGLILSMPAGANPLLVRDAARDFARKVFAGSHEYLLVLHTDTPHPHVHLAVKAGGEGGMRLNPKKADLESWRQGFARALREHGIEAEATPRRARGVVRKPERMAVRRLRERHAAGRGPMPRVLAAAYHEAAHLAFSGERTPTAWEVRIARRQARLRALYQAQIALLLRSPRREDRRLAETIDAFFRGLPAPVTRRLDLARELRAVNRQERIPKQGPERQR